MIAAIYARKSNEQVGVADDAKSVSRQITHAREYAARKGWTVAGEYIFSDDGISGAEFEGRPGFVRLMAALRPGRAPFNVLIMSEESRLGREQQEVGYAFKQLVSAGVRIFLYLEDRERLLESATDKFMLSVASFADEMERERARTRTRDALLHKARTGYVTGGSCFGYTNVRTDAGVRREINPEEAAIVRRIFELCRDGKGSARISYTLNAEGAPAPRAQQHRPHGWVPSSVRAVLYRDLYRGQQIWGRSRKRNTRGQISGKRTPESTWVRTSVPSLRIVDDELWEAAHERMSSSRANYLQKTNGKLWGKPANGIESKYLLTGMATCGACGGGMLVFPRVQGSPGRRKRVHMYACPRARVRLCPNDLEVPMTIADSAALAMISTDVLSDDIVALALDKLMALFDVQPEDLDARRKAITTQLRKVEKELAHLQSAVAAGDPLDTLLQGIADREQRARQFKAELSALDSGPALVAASGQVRAEALRLLRDWRGLLGQHVAISRQLLRKVLDRERFTFYPQGQGDERWYDVGVKPSLAAFLASVPTLKNAVASPMPASWNQVAAWLQQIDGLRRAA